MPLLQKALIAAASSAVLLGVAACATEPKLPYFDGIIVSRISVTDIYEGTTTTYLKVDRSPGPPDTCTEQADVTVTDSTLIAWVSTPARQETRAVLEPGRAVRVLPGTDPRDICPMQLNATSVLVADS